MLRNLQRVRVQVRAALFVAVAAIAPVHDWKRITPVDVGFLPNVTERLHERFECGDFGKLHGVAVVITAGNYGAPDATGLARAVTEACCCRP